jgi:hypothetical protein
MCEGKTMQVNIRGKRNKVVEWTSSIVSTTLDHIKPKCRSRNLTSKRGWERCIWKIPSDEVPKFAIGFDGVNVEDLDLSARLI